MPWYSSRGPRPEISQTPAEEYVHPTRVERNHKMSRSAKIDIFARINMHPISAWSYERDPAADAETDAMIIAARQKLAKTPLAAGTPPLPNVRPVISTPTASSPAALPVERVAEYLHSDPNGPEIQLASMIVDQQLEAEAAVAAAARMKADEERAAVSAAAPDSPIHDWSDEALDAQIRSEINARQLEEAAIEMSQPEPIPHIRIPKIAGYLKADEGKVETALMNLADRGYAIQVPYSPEKWVRVVPVEVELMPPPYAVYHCAGGLFDELFASEHYDPAGAIHASEDSMFIKAADGHAQKLLDAEKTHQIKLLADQAKETRKRLRAEKDKNRRRELRIDLAKATRRLDCLRKLTVRVDTTAEALVSAPAGGDTDTDQALIQAAPGVETTDAAQALVSAAAGVDTTDAEQAPVVAATGVDTTDAEQALVPAAPGVDSTDAEQALVAAATGADTTDAEQAAVVAAPGVDNDAKQAVVSAPAGVNTTDTEQALVAAAAGVDTNDAEQTLVVAPAGVGTEARQTLVVAAPDRIANPLYQELVRCHLRVGQPLSVESTGNDEMIRQYGPGTPGGLDWCRATVRRSNGLPQPVSGPAAAIFQHFIKIQYRDVRSSVIQEVLKDCVEGGGTLDAKSESDATRQAELAFWLHCSETRKASICVHGFGFGPDGSACVSVYCPQGTCFHPDAFGYIGDILFLNDGASVSIVTGCGVSGFCNEEDVENAVQAMIKLFADTPGLLVTDWPFAAVQLPEK